MNSIGGVESLRKVLAQLDPRHRLALSWFRGHAGERVNWPPALIHGSESVLLACKPKGIYKPRWMRYALSVRETKLGQYDDREISGDVDHCRYEYHQEGASRSLKRVATNLGLVSCLADAVPVGVIRQVGGAGEAKYLVQGLALVEGFCDGYFHLRLAGDPSE